MTTFAVSIEISKYSEAKKFSGICSTVFSDHTQQVSIFCVRTFAFSTTPINEVCLEPLSPSCRHGVKSAFLLGQPNGHRFSYIRSRYVETSSSSISEIYESRAFERYIDCPNRLLSWWSLKRTSISYQWGMLKTLK